MLSSDSSQSVTVVYETTETGGAQAGSDYTYARGTLTFNPGEMQTITVETTDDDVAESTEAFTFTVTNGRRQLDSGGLRRAPSSTTTMAAAAAVAAVAVVVVVVVVVVAVVVVAAVVAVAAAAVVVVDGGGVAAPSLPCPLRTRQRARATPPSSSSH